MWRPSAKAMPDTSSLKVTCRLLCCGFCGTLKWQRSWEMQIEHDAGPSFRRVRWLNNILDSTIPYSLSERETLEELRESSWLLPPKTR
jgi:hypothetical protein